MIAKTSIGGTIGSALAYGAGELGKKNKEAKAGKVDLLATYNLSSLPGDSPRAAHVEMAQEMQAVIRDTPSKCQNPVWHTSLSMPTGQKLDEQTWTKAVDIYLKSVGIDTEKHQVAVFRHRDTAHDHVHIYANRIGIYGGPAVKTGWNYKANVVATTQITKELGLLPITKDTVRVSLKDHVQGKQAGREVVETAIKKVLQRGKPKNLDELRRALERQQVSTQLYPSDSTAPSGIGFKAEGHQGVNGTEIGYKFDHLSALMEANRMGYQAKKQAKPIRAERQQTADDAKEISQRLSSVLNQKSTNTHELKVALLATGVEVKYIDDARGIYGVSFKLTEKEHDYIKGSAIQLGDGKAKWGSLNQILEINRVEKQAQTERPLQTQEVAPSVNVQTIQPVATETLASVPTEKPKRKVSKASARNSEYLLELLEMTGEKFADNSTVTQPESIGKADLPLAVVTVASGSDRATSHPPKAAEINEPIMVDGGKKAVNKPLNGENGEVNQSSPVVGLALQTPQQLAEIREKIGSLLVGALAMKPTTREELASDLANVGVVITYAQKSDGTINKVTFQLAETEDQPIEGSAIKMQQSRAEWVVLNQILAANRAAYEAEIAKKQDEAAQEKAAKEILEKELEKVKQERDAALNQPPTTVTETIEKKVSDPDDKATIKRLEKENKKLTKDNETGQAQITDLIEGHKLAIEEAYLKRDTIQEAFNKIALIKPLPPKEVEKVVYRDSPAQQVIITEQAREIAGLKEQLKFREWITNSLKNIYKCEPTPERVIALEERKRVATPEIGYCLWIQSNGIKKEIKCEPLPLKEQFVHLMKFEPTEKMLANLETGGNRSYERVGLTIWLNKDGILKSKPYIKSEQSLAPASQSNAPTSNQQKRPETGLQPGKATDSAKPLLSESTQQEQKWKPEHDKLVKAYNDGQAYNLRVSEVAKRLLGSPTLTTARELLPQTEGQLHQELTKQITTHQKWEQDVQKRIIDIAQVKPIADGFWPTQERSEARLRLAYLETPTPQTSKAVENKDYDWWVSRQDYVKSAPKFELYIPGCLKKLTSPETSKDYATRKEKLYRQGSIVGPDGKMCPKEERTTIKQTVATETNKQSPKL